MKRGDKTCCMCGRLGSGAFRPHESTMGGRAVSLWECGNRFQCEMRQARDVSGQGRNGAMEARLTAWRIVVGSHSAATNEVAKAEAVGEEEKRDG